MSEPTVLVVGGRNQALDRIFAEAGLRIEEGAAASPSPELVVAPVTNGGETLRDLRRRYPAAEFLLLVPFDEIAAGQRVAHAMGADVVPVPPDRRRTAETVRRALERRALRLRHECLLDRVRALDPTLGAEIEIVIDEAERTGRELDEAVRLRSSFIANISHEIRTPVTVMQGMLEVLEEDLHDRLAPEEIDLLERVRVSGDNLLELVQGFLDLAKADAGVLEVRPTEVYFPDLIADVTRKVAPSLQEKPIRLVTDVTRGIEWLTVDGEKLNQLVTNLLSNAVKFTARGEVRLEARLVGDSPKPVEPDAAQRVRAPAPTGDTLEIVVADTGKGISREDQELIFEAFRQVDVSATREHEGIGLGLTLVRQMAQLLHASIQLDSEPGRGTRFTVRLPVSSIEGPAVEVRGSRRAAVRARRRVPESRGPFAELADLLRARSSSRGDAIAFALDFVERLVRVRVTLFAERASRGWRIIDVLDRGGGGLAPGDPLPFADAAIERAVRERRPQREPGAGGDWLIVTLLDDGEAGGVLALAGEPGGENDLSPHVLQIASRWLGGELERDRLLRERAELVSLVGREVKTPLGTLLAYTQSLLRGLCGPLSRDQRTAVLRLERTLHRVILSSLDLLDLERASRRSLVGAPRTFSLGSVIDHVLARHSAALEIGAYRIRKEVPPDLPSCVGDEIRTDRSISNLLRALLERLPHSSEIRIEVGASPDFVRCDVSATPADVAPFLDGLAREARRPEIGETLGLRLTRVGIESQGGRLELLQSADELTVRLSLPREPGGIAA